MKETTKVSQTDSTSRPPNVPSNPGPPDGLPVTLPGTVEDKIPRQPIDEEWPVEEITLGWQQPAIEIPSPIVKCAHIGRVFAAMQIHFHDVGHEWICQCGQVFVVVVNKGDKKVLRKKEEVVDADPVID